MSMKNLENINISGKMKHKNETKNNESENSASLNPFKWNFK